MAHMACKSLYQKLATEFFSASFIKFAIVGVINTIIDFAVFFALYELAGWNMIYSNICAFLVAVTNSYFMNKYFSFAHHKEKRISMAEFVIFVTASIATLSLSTAILVLGEPYLPVLYLKIIAAIITPLLNFLIYRFVIFQKKS